MINDSDVFSSLINLKHMLHFKLAFLIVFVASFTQAQLLTPQTFSAAGASSSNGSVVLEYTMGGLSVSTISTSTFMYTQGFLQPEAGTTNTVPPINNVALSTGSVLDNAGTTLINGSTMVEFSLGEMACSTLNGTNAMLTQGILQPYHYFIWTGVVNNLWIEPGNWNIGVLPIKSDEVLIPPGCPNYPVLENTHRGHCRMLTAQAGTSVTVNNGGILRLHQYF
jgi:hypothetical protein